MAQNRVHIDTKIYRYSQNITSVLLCWKYFKYGYLYDRRQFIDARCPVCTSMNDVTIGSGYVVSLVCRQATKQIKADLVSDVL